MTGEPSLVVSSSKQIGHSAPSGPKDGTAFARTVGRAPLPLASVAACKAFGCSVTTVTSAVDAGPLVAGELLRWDRKQRQLRPDPAIHAAPHS